jgi:hypothetical protein
VSYDITVVDAEKHGTGIAAYLTYEVRTKMTGGAFGERAFAVRRRYTDFVWLRSTLADNYLHALIPVLSDKEKLPAQVFNISGQQHKPVDTRENPQQQASIQNAPQVCALLCSAFDFRHSELTSHCGGVWPSWS